MSDSGRIIYGKNAPVVGETPAVILDNPKYTHNLGQTIRAASAFGVSQVWFTGDRIRLDEHKRLPREERMKGYKDVELIQYDYPLDAFADDVVPVAIEVRDGSIPLENFWHPDNAVYVFGPEDGSVSGGLLPLCHYFVQISSFHCLNLSMAVGVVLFHRNLKLWEDGRLDLLPELNEERGFIDYAI